MGLSAFTAAIENPVSRALLLGGLLENGGIPKLRRITLQGPPTSTRWCRPSQGPRPDQVSFEPAPPPKDFAYLTARDYAKAYRDGTLSPLEVAERVLAAIEASDQGEAPLRAFIAVNRQDVLAQAQAAQERIHSGQALSPMDGVPVAVKDEIDMQPYPTTVGTRFLGTAPASAGFDGCSQAAGSWSAAGWQGQHARDRHQPEWRQRPPRDGAQPL